MTKNKISLQDFKLRLFLDTNVLIDFVEECDRKKCVVFLKMFGKSKIRKKAKVSDVELVTSDYVLWEFYGHCKEESYAKWLIEKYNCGLISVGKECKNANFNQADPEQMNQFGNEIKEHIKNMTEDEEIVYLHRLIGQEIAGFSETIDKILQCSKFSYKDAIVLTSAYFTQANMIITCDEQHFGQGHLDQLKEALGDWPINPGQMEYRKPDSFSNLSKIRSVYKEWFIKRNKSKIIGTIVKYYPRKNVMEIKCKKGCSLSENDSVYLARFFNNENLGKFWLKIPPKANGNFRIMRTNNSIDEGQHVTIKIPSKFPYKKKEWTNGWVFLAE